MATMAFCSVALLLCLRLFHPSQAIEVSDGGGGGYGEEEKIPLSAVIVPDPSPELRAPSPGLSPTPAPPPVSGAGGDDIRPRLPTERWRRGEERRSGSTSSSSHHAHAHGHAHAHAAAPPPYSWGPGPARAPGPAASAAPDSGAGESGGTAFIRSSPAVPVPRGVTDTATILPMPTPGDKRQEVGAAAASARPGVVPIVVGLTMMASFWALH